MQRKKPNSVEMMNDSERNLVRLLGRRNTINDAICFSMGAFIPFVLLFQAPFLPLASIPSIQAGLTSSSARQAAKKSLNRHLGALLIGATLSTGTSFAMNGACFESLMVNKKLCQKVVVSLAEALSPKDKFVKSDLASFDAPSLSNPVSEVSDLDV